MVLFICPSNMYVQKLMIPFSRVYEIVCSDCSVIVNYESGEMVEVNGKFEKKIESAKVTFDSVDDVDKISRQFYKAVANRASAFFIGNIKPDENPEEKKN